MPNVKLCRKCNVVKELETDYYRAGKNWQKYCKICHNKDRPKYKPAKYKYVRKGTGFCRVPKEIQEKIIYDFYVKISGREIAETYGLKQATLLGWRRKGQIPDYVEPDEIKTDEIEK